MKYYKDCYFKNMLYKFDGKTWFIYNRDKSKWIVSHKPVRMFLDSITKTELFQELL